MSSARRYNYKRSVTMAPSLLASLEKRGSVDIANRAMSGNSMPKPTSPTNGSSKAFPHARSTSSIPTAQSGDSPLFDPDAMPMYKLDEDISRNTLKNYIIRVLRSPKCNFFQDSETVSFKVGDIHQQAQMYNHNECIIDVLKMLDETNAHFNSFAAFMSSMQTLAVMTKPPVPVTSAPLSTRPLSRNGGPTPILSTRPISTNLEDDSFFKEAFARINVVGGNPSRANTQKLSSKNGTSEILPLVIPEDELAPSTQIHTARSQRNCTSACSACGCSLKPASTVSYIKYNQHNQPYVSTKEVDSTNKPTQSSRKTAIDIDEQVKTHYSHDLVPNYKKLTESTLTSRVDNTKKQQAVDASKQTNGAEKPLYQSILEYITHSNCSIFGKGAQAHRGIKTSKDGFNELLAAGGGNLFDLFLILDAQQDKAAYSANFAALVRTVSSDFKKEHEARRTFVQNFLRSKRCLLLDAPHVETNVFEIDQLISICADIVRHGKAAQSHYYQRVSDHRILVDQLKREHVSAGLGGGGGSSSSLKTNDESSSNTGSRTNLLQNTTETTNTNQMTSKKIEEFVEPELPPPPKLTNMKYMIVAVLDTMQRNGVRVTDVKELVTLLQQGHSWQNIQALTIAHATEKGEIATDISLKPVLSGEWKMTDAMQSVIDYLSHDGSAQLMTESDNKLILRRTLLQRIVTGGLVLPSTSAADEETAYHHLPNDIVTNSDVFSPINGQQARPAQGTRTRASKYFAVVSSNCVLYIQKMFHSIGYVFQNADVLADAVCYYLRFPHAHPHPPLAPRAVSKTNEPAYAAVKTKPITNSCLTTLDDQQTHISVISSTPSKNAILITDVAQLHTLSTSGISIIDHYGVATSYKMSFIDSVHSYGSQNPVARRMSIVTANETN